MDASRFMLRPDDDAYPVHLLDAPRPPVALYGMGSPTCLVRGLAVVGSRKATPYGLACATRFAGLAAEWGVTIISGAAIGCDLAAHRAALTAGGATVAVLGCGADVDYPKSAAGVLAEVRSGRGAVVSELDWGSPPLRHQFPARNRIIAGLSAAVLVVEAALPSGTFSTADHALDAGREVFAVPGSVFFSGSAGCNRLIRQGAQPICCDEDLRDSLVGVGLLSASSSVPECDRLTGSYEYGVGAAVAAHPMTPDELAAALGLDIITVMREIARLEQLGAAARYPDGRYGPCIRG